MTDVLVVLSGAVLGLFVFGPYVYKYRAEVVQGWRDVLGLSDEPRPRRDRPVRRKGWWVPFVASGAIGGITLAVGAIFGRWPLIVLGIAALVFAGGGLLVAWRSWASGDGWY